MKINQFGRSMVEMLGVLAIVGVLSVGAIAGYQKAMFKYKLNKQAQQLSHIISVVDRYYEDLKVDNLIPILKQLNEIPKGMFKYKKTPYMYDVFDSLYHIYYHGAGYTGILSWINDDNYSTQICRNIYLTAKSFSNNIDKINISKQGSDYNTNLSSHYGNNICTVKNQPCIKDLTIAEIDNICKICKKTSTGNCLIYIMWFHGDAYF